MTEPEEIKPNALGLAPDDIPRALPKDRLAWSDGEIVIDGEAWEAVVLTSSVTGPTVVRAHIGQNRWRVASRPLGGEWEWT